LLIDDEGLWETTIAEELTLVLGLGRFKKSTPPKELKDSFVLILCIV
jgi:hypothetical protein